MVAVINLYLQYLTGKNRFFNKNIGILRRNLSPPSSTTIFLQINIEENVLYKMALKKMPATAGKIFFFQVQNFFFRRWVIDDSYSEGKFTEYVAFEKVDFLQKWLKLFLTSTILGKFFKFLVETDLSAHMGSHNDVTKPIFSLVNW